MRRSGIYLLLVLLLCCRAGYAQNINSLKKELNTARSAAATMRLQYAIGDAYFWERALDSSIMYLNMGEAVARKTGDDSMVMECVISTAYTLVAQNKFDAAFLRYDTAILLARQLRVQERLMHFIAEKATVLSDFGPSPVIVEHCKELLVIARARNDKLYEARAYFILGSYFAGREQFAAGIDYLGKSIRLFDSLKQENRLIGAYRAISITYARQKKYAVALRYALVMDSAIASRGEDRPRNYNRMHMGVLYKNLGQYDRAIDLYRVALQGLARDSFAQMMLYDNMAIAQSMKGDFADARRSFQLALDINSAFGQKGMYIEVYKELGSAFLRVKQYDSALYFASKAEQLSRADKNDLATYRDCLGVLCAIADAKGDGMLAAGYYKRYVAVQDTIYTRNHASDLADAETKFNVAEKDKELSILATENELQRLRARQQTILIVSLLVGLALGVVIVVLAVRSNRRTLKQNALLNEQKQALQAQKEVLEEQKKVIDQQVVQLDSAAKMKSKFLANISHELRTPVTLLNGMLGMMRTNKQQHGQTREQQRLDVAYNNSRKLQHMVEEILDLTKLEHNRTQPIYEVREAAPMLRRMVYAFETLIEKEELVLEYDDAGAAGAYLSVDLASFEKVINNLVYNAIKFNRKGGAIRVKVSANAKYVGIQVSDTGIGIAAADLPHIFEHFYQGESQGLKATGAGIGLSLVKEFTELMGGSVQVSSKQGEGSTFVLQYPVVEHVVTEQPEAEAMELPAEHWEIFAKRQLVLLVEDNAEMRYYLKEVLGDNVNITEAGNGGEALEWLEGNMPDLIISDVMMPGIDGRELVSYLKSQERFKKIPIITLTALADKENQISFLKLGIDDYIVKPFNADELRVRVYNLLANQAERNRYNEQPAAPEEEVTDTKAIEEFRTRVTSYVLANIKNSNISVFDLAYDMSLSERQLFRLAKSLTGCTPAQLVKEVRLQKAYELLVSGDINKIEDVARRVGFEKASYFSKQFFDRFGKRATDFL